MYVETTAEERQEKAAIHHVRNVGENIHRAHNGTQLNAEERDALNRDMRKPLRADKKRWHRDQIQRYMSKREQWQGIKLMKQSFKPKTYSRKTMHGQAINLNERASATAEYL